MSSVSSSRKESERAKLIQEKCQTLLTQMLRDEDNKYCVDCDAKGPRWASWNLGVFLCIRCAGIHRNLGVHISRVKSVNLDSWTPEQVISLQQMGNSRARAVYEAQLPDGFRRPQTDNALESFIRSKYEHRKYLAREWVPPSPPKVCWAKEIDEELEKQKRKKKAAMTGNTLNFSTLGATGSSERKSSVTAPKKSPLPAPLPKPKGNQRTGSPKATQSTPTNTILAENDLLGLSSPVKPSSLKSTISGETNSDSFTSFLAADPPAGNVSRNAGILNNVANVQNPSADSLAKEEEDFFNYGSINVNEGPKGGKLSKDGILALYGAPSANTLQNNFAKFTGMNSGFAQHVQPHSQHQFMTPPNSVSMHISPVMTAPAAFITSTLNTCNSPNLFGASYSSAAAGYSSLPNNLQATNQNIISSVAPNSTVPGPNSNINLSNRRSAPSYFSQPLQALSVSTPANTQQVTCPSAVTANLTVMPSNSNTAAFSATKPNPSAVNEEFAKLSLGNVFP